MSHFKPCAICYIFELCATRRLPKLSAIYYTFGLCATCRIFILCAICNMLKPFVPSSLLPAQLSTVHPDVNHCEIATKVRREICIISNVRKGHEFLARNDTDRCSYVELRNVM
jgi:hypothetical protein